MAAPGASYDITATTQQSRFHAETLEGSFTGDVDLHQLDLLAGDAELLSNARLRLRQGVRYGLVGANGAGKSTLLRALGEGLVVGFPPGVRALHVAQLEGGDAAARVVDVLLDTDREAVALRRRAAQLEAGLAGAIEGLALLLKQLRVAALEGEVQRAGLTNDLRSGSRGNDARMALLEVEAKLDKARAGLGEAPSRQQLAAAPGVARAQLAEAQEQLVSLGAAGQEARARAILAGLGFSPAMAEAEVKTLSGGWRMRAALGRALFLEPDLLLLDEPTNHLDLPAILWLQGYLRGELEGVTAIVVSHDRAFLDAATQETIVLRNRLLEYHEGAYTAYRQSYEERQAHLLHLKEGLDKKRAHVERSIQANLAAARKTGDDKKLSQVASRKKKLADRWGHEKNEAGHRFSRSKDMAGFQFSSRTAVEVDAPEAAPAFRIAAPEPLRNAGPLVQLEGASFAYPGGSKPPWPVLRDVTFCLEQGEKVALVGANGEGKSTAVKLMLGLLGPSGGTAARHPQATVGTFAQDQVDELRSVHGASSAIARLKALFPEAREQELHRSLGSWGLKGATARTHMSRLSGGQLVRVALAASTYRAPHLLVLDEPSNHLDILAIEALGPCLKEFAGAVLLVSHDQHLVESVADKVYLVAKQSVRLLEGGVQQYIDKLRRGPRRAAGR